jgi:hypothetical protein
MTQRAFALAALAAVVALTGCGGSNRDPGQPGQPSSAELQRALDEATKTSVAAFPAVEGGTLQQVADGLAGGGPEVGLATSTFVPGTNRLAFGIIDRQTGFVYGPTAVYIARSPERRARGPYPAPADSLITDAPFRSKTAASEDDPFAAVYSARVPLRSPGTWAVLAVTKVKGQLFGAGTQIKVISRNADSIPKPGDTAPRATTDTFASAGGNKALVDTRRPFDDMHAASFADVAGKKPVALLFATPQLCQSRVCGPVTDIAAQLESKYRDRMTFIHQEVYVDNDPNKGLREPLRRFALRSEPWLFTIDATGKIAARLEGSFGFRDFDQAIKAALGR